MHLNSKFAENVIKLLEERDIQNVSYDSADDRIVVRDERIAFINLNAQKYNGVHAYMTNGISIHVYEDIYDYHAHDDALVVETGFMPMSIDRRTDPVAAADVIKALLQIYSPKRPSQYCVRATISIEINVEANNLFHASALVEAMSATQLMEQGTVVGDMDIRVRQV